MVYINHHISTNHNLSYTIAKQTIGLFCILCFKATCCIRVDRHAKVLYKTVVMRLFSTSADVSRCRPTSANACVNPPLGLYGADEFV